MVSVDGQTAAASLSPLISSVAECPVRRAANSPSPVKRKRTHSSQRKANSPAASFYPVRHPCKRMKLRFTGGLREMLKDGSKLVLQMAWNNVEEDRMNS